MGLPADKAALTASLEKINISSGDSEAVLGALSSYLSSAGHVVDSQKDKVSALLAQGKGIVESLLPSLGIVPKIKGLTGAESQSDSEKAVAEAGRDGQVVEVVDVRDFKAGLPLSEGLKAVRGLEEFEELDAKL